MADRVSSESDPGVPKEVFELDKDERWQARIEEARARREVALREKAAGEPKKPRPKPWEIEGSGVDEPPIIEPIIQERGDDKFDFADRLESIKDSQKESAAPEPVAPPLVPRAKRQVAGLVEPDTGSRAPAAEPRARPQPSLILPGAPDVSEIAARYAATLKASDEVERALDLEEQIARDAETVVPLTPDSAAIPRKLTRAERRRGIRPLGMALALLLFAALPFSTEAPPLEKGPEMPVIGNFGVIPALGVTWSLAERPVETDASDWQPVAVATQLVPAPVDRPAGVGAAALTMGASPVVSELDFDWSALVPFSARPPLATLPQPVDRQTPNVSFTGPADLATPSEPIIPEDILPTTGVAPVTSSPPSIRATQPDARPVPADRNVRLEPVDPLRVTILTPPQADGKLAEDIANGVQNDGHELVRIRSVDFSISERNVRFFHDEDRVSAARLAEKYEAELRDFTWFQPRPVEGTAELWLSGQGDVPVEAPAAEGVADTPAPANSPFAENQLLERLFDRLGLSTNLPRVLGGDSN